jgi:putative DNA primase/helicase
MSELNAAGIPAELKQRSQWVLWRYEGTANRNGKRDKVPYLPNGQRASVSDPRTWSEFGQVLALAPRYTGIGIVCANGPAGIDLDNCLDDGGNLSPLAQHIIARSQTYTELTPSERGLRCLFTGKLPGPGFKDEAQHVEFYDGGRYFTVMGNH